MTAKELLHATEEKLKKAHEAVLRSFAEVRSGRATLRSPRRRILPYTCGRSRTNPCIACWSYEPTLTASGSGLLPPRPNTAAKSWRLRRTRHTRSDPTGAATCHHQDRSRR